MVTMQSSARHNSHCPRVDNLLSIYIAERTQALRQMKAFSTNRCIAEWQIDDAKNVWLLS
jgi:hypothetical protein